MFQLFIILETISGFQDFHFRDDHIRNKIVLVIGDLCKKLKIKCQSDTKKMPVLRKVPVVISAPVSAFDYPDQSANKEPAEWRVKT